MSMINMTPDLVFQIVAANPNLRHLVEQSVQLQQLQAQAGYMAPLLQQMSQSPMGNAAGISWNPQAQQQQATQQVPQQATQQVPQQATQQVPQQATQQVPQQVPQADAQPVSQQEQVAAIIQQAFDGLQGSVATLTATVGGFSDRLMALEEAGGKVATKTAPAAAKVVVKAGEK